MKKETLQLFLTNFKKEHLESVDKIQARMIDKDLTERAVLKELFPNVQLLLCEFHVLKIFSRKITTSSMNISKE